MFKLILIIVISYILVRIGLFDLGHMTIFIAKYRVDLTLVTAIIILAIIFLLLYYLMRLMVKINHLPAALRASRLRKILARQRNKLNQAQLNYISGKYQLAIKNLEQVKAKELLNDESFIILATNYELAIKLNKLDLALDSLNELDKFTDKRYDLAKLTLKARYWLFTHNYLAAIANLNTIIEIDKNNILAHQLRLKALQAQGSAEKAFNDMLWLSKHAIILEADLVTTSCKLFANLNDEAEIKYYYRKLDSKTASNTEVIASYQIALTKAGER